MNKRKPTYVVIKEEYLKSYKLHFTRGKRYKVDRDGIWITDSGVELLYNSRYCIEVIKENIIGGEIIC